MNEETFIAACPEDHFRLAAEAALLRTEWSQDQSGMTWAWYPLPTIELETQHNGRVYMVMSAAVGPYQIIWLEAEYPNRRVLLDTQRGDDGIDAEYLLDLFGHWTEEEAEER